MTKRKNPFNDKNSKVKKSKNLEIEFLDLEVESFEILPIQFYINYKEYEKKGKKSCFNLDYNWLFQKIGLGDVTKTPELIGKGTSGIVYNFSTVERDYAVKIIGNPELEDGFKGTKEEYSLHIVREIYKFSFENPQLKNLRKEVDTQIKLNKEDLAPEVYKFGFLSHNTKRGYYSHCFIVMERFQTDVSSYIKTLKKNKDRKGLQKLQNKLEKVTERLSENEFVCMDFKTDNMVINPKTMNIKVIDFEGRFCMSFKRFVNKLQTTYLRPVTSGEVRKLLQLTYLYIIFGISIRKGVVLCLDSMIRVWKLLNNPEDEFLNKFFNTSTNSNENFAKNIEHYFDRYQLFNLFRVVLKSKRLRRKPHFIEKKNYPKIFNSMEREYKSCDHCYIL